MQPPTNTFFINKLPYDPNVGAIMDYIIVKSFEVEWNCCQNDDCIYGGFNWDGRCNWGYWIYEWNKFVATNIACNSSNEVQCILMNFGWHVANYNKHKFWSGTSRTCIAGLDDDAFPVRSSYCVTIMYLIHISYSCYILTSWGSVMHTLLLWQMSITFHLVIS